MHLTVNQTEKSYGGSNPSSSTKHSLVVQMAERRVLDPYVVGSNPTEGSNARVTEWQTWSTQNALS